MAQPTEYRTPSGRLCPYEGMTDQELDDFERWADKTDRSSRSGAVFALVLFALILIGFLAI